MSSEKKPPHAAMPPTAELPPPTETPETTTSPEDILQAARYWGWKIATAESCTGGMVAARLTDVAGASDVFERGFVTYSNDAKMEMLGVSPSTLERHGAVSEEVAQEMAEGALWHSTAGISVSITGIAGPGGSEFKPEGRVCFGLALRGKKTHVETVEFGALGRAQVRAAACEHALALLAQALG
ncbi:MAG: CinA family protein [Cypionkella sp.]